MLQEKAAETRWNEDNNPKAAEKMWKDYHKWEVERNKKSRRLRRDTRRS